MAMPGVTWVAKSLLAGLPAKPPMKTLSVYVSRTVMSGVTVQRAAAGADEVMATAKTRTVAPQGFPLASAIPVIAVIRPGFRLRRFIEERHDDRTGLDGREGGFDGCVGSFLRLHHHDDLPRAAGEHAGFRRGEERWRIENDNAIRIAAGDLLGEPPHFIAREQLVGGGMRPARQ